MQIRQDHAYPLTRSFSGGDTAPDGHKRAQAKAKKKKGLEGYFGTGTCVPPPNREGTPIDAVGKRRGEEDKPNIRTRGEGGCTLKLTAHGYRDKSYTGGEGDQRGNREKSMQNLEGTPVSGVDRRRGGEDKANAHTKRGGESWLTPMAHGYKDNSNKGGEGDQRRNGKNLRQTWRGPQLMLAEEE